MANNIVRKPMPEGRKKEKTAKEKDVALAENEPKEETKKHIRNDIEETANKILGIYMLQPAKDYGVSADMIACAEDLWKFCSLDFKKDCYCIDLNFVDGFTEPHILNVLSKYTGLDTAEIKDMFGDVYQINSQFPEFNNLLVGLKRWDYYKGGINVKLETIALQKECGVTNRLLMADIINRDNHPDFISREPHNSETSSDWLTRISSEINGLCLPEAGFIDAVVSQNYKNIESFLIEFSNIKQNLFKTGKPSKFPKVIIDNNESLDDYTKEPSRRRELDAICEEFLFEMCSGILDNVSNRKTEPYTKEEKEAFVYLMVHGLYKTYSPGNAHTKFELQVNPKRAIEYLSSFAEEPAKAEKILNDSGLFTKDTWAQDYLNEFKQYNHYLTEILDYFNGDDIFSNSFEQELLMDNLKINPGYEKYKNEILNLLKVKPVYRPIIAAVLKKAIDDKSSITEKQIFSVFKEYELDKSKTKEALKEMYCAGILK